MAGVRRQSIVERCDARDMGISEEIWERRQERLGSYERVAESAAVDVDEVVGWGGW